MVLVCVCTLAMAALVPAVADVMPGKYRMEPVLRNLTRPSDFALAPDGRIFYLERMTGNVRVVQGGKLVTAPFVTVSVATGAHAGLVGVAVHPRFRENGWVYVYYTQASPLTNRIVRYTDAANTGTNPLVILDNIGAVASGEDNGGVLNFGNDGKLYVSVGVMEGDSSAQSMTSLLGKVLRINEDGTVPVDNPFVGSGYPYNLIYALGFRDGTGLAFNASSGTLYSTDNNESDAGCDEVDVVRSGQDYGWSVDSCAGTGGTHVAPMQQISPTGQAWGVASYTKTKYPGAGGNLFVSASGNGKIVQDVLTGAAYDTLSSSTTFYDPTGQASCPLATRDLHEGRDGWLYALSDDPTPSKAGLYRAIYDNYGGTNAKPREVSGSAYMEMGVAKDSGSGGLKLTFEDVKKDAWTCSTMTSPVLNCPAGAKTTKYTVWSGPLVSPFAYNHTALAETNGTVENDMLLNYPVSTMPTDSRYYLVSAHGANLEGSLGTRSDGITERPGAATQDLCTLIGTTPGNGINKCAVDWPHTYPDQNNNLVQLSDFRGRAVYMSFMQFG
jgi:glucose/arabinose dehydrogenase